MDLAQAMSPMLTFNIIFGLSPYKSSRHGRCKKWYYADFYGYAYFVFNIFLQAAVFILYVPVFLRLPGFGGVVWVLFSWSYTSNSIFRSFMFLINKQVISKHLQRVDGFESIHMKADFRPVYLFNKCLLGLTLFILIVLNAVEHFWTHDAQLNTIVDVFGVFSRTAIRMSCLSQFLAYICAMRILYGKINENLLSSKQSMVSKEMIKMMIKADDMIKDFATDANFTFSVVTLFCCLEGFFHPLFLSSSGWFSVKHLTATSVWLIYCESLIILVLCVCGLLRRKVKSFYFGFFIAFVTAVIYNIFVIRIVSHKSKI